MNEQNPRQKRHFKTILINPKFQLSMIGYTSMLALALWGTLYFALKTFFARYLEEGKSIQLAPDHPFFTFLQDQQAYMNQVFLVVGLVFLLIAILFGLIVSHRIAGPLFKLKNFFDGIASGEEPRQLMFRKHDFFLDLPVSINSAMENLKKK